jgi:hypothetical protein
MTRRNRTLHSPVSEEAVGQLSLPRLVCLRALVDIPVNRMTPMVQLTMRLQTTIANFFSATLVANLALLLNIDSSRLKIVSELSARYVKPEYTPQCN